MKTVSFAGTCGAAAQKVLVSKRIGHPYIVRKVSARFAQGCNNTLKLRFYVSRDKDAPIATEPNGVSMLRDYGQEDFIFGNDDTKIMKHDVIVEERGTYLKVLGVNTDTFEHTIDVQMEIEEKERK